MQRLQPQPGHYRARDEVLGRLDRLLREAGGLWEVSRLHVEPYGSYLSGLFSLESDLDIAIEGDGPDGCGCRCWFGVAELPRGLVGSGLTEAVEGQRLLGVVGAALCDSACTVGQLGKAGPGIIQESRQDGAVWGGVVRGPEPACCLETCAAGGAWHAEAVRTGLQARHALQPPHGSWRTGHDATRHGALCTCARMHAHGTAGRDLIWLYCGAEGGACCRTFWHREQQQHVDLDKEERVQVLKVGAGSRAGSEGGCFRF